MAALSDWLENVMASHIFGSGTFSKPSTIAIALCANPALDASTGALTGKELADAGGYARQSYGPGSAQWKDPAGTDGATYNHSIITFPTATSDWGWVSGVAICDSATHGGGNLLFHGALATPKLIGSGDAFLFSPSGLSAVFS